MGKNILKRGFIIGVVCMFLSTTCLPIVNASDGKPDLIIEGLGTIQADDFIHNKVYCVVKNIGSENANNFIDVKVHIKRVIFGVFLINKTLDSFFANRWDSGGLPPNSTTGVNFTKDYQLPQGWFRIYRIYCQVNPDKRIEETDYNNNFYTQDVLVFFSDWEKALG
ncbi:MAG: hypothetical protein IMZ53_12230 [Thermoplasmata archaeon]|nr:hypothetical protein [Thermoplasmata archaeon]